MKIKGLILTLLLPTICAASLFAQTQTGLQTTRNRQTLTITNAAVDSDPVATMGDHQAAVQLIFGTVSGSYSGCTVQARTSVDGTNYLTLSTAKSITMTTGTSNAWTIIDPVGTAVSATAANSFGAATRFTLACSSYGTSATANLSVVYSPISTASISTTIDTTGIATSTNQTNGAAKSQIVDGSGNVIGSTSNSLNVNVTGGSTGNGAASNTGSAVPAQGDYLGVNIGGTLRGVTGTNTAGSTFAADVNIAGDSTSVAQGSTTSGQTGPLNQAAVTTAAPSYANATTRPLSLDTAGSLRVSVASGTVTAVQGTASNLKAQVTGTGAAGTADSGVVTVQGIASMTPVLATLSGTNNINNVSGTVSLPTGAATATKQSDGSQKSQIVDGSGNVIGATSNALDVNIKSGASTGYAQGSTTSGQLGPLNQGAVTTAAPTYMDGQTSPISLDTSGALRVNVTSGAAVGYAQGSTTSGQVGGLVQGAVTTASPSYANGQTSPLNMDTSGSLRVAVVSGSTGNAAAGNTGSAVPTQADYNGVNVGGNLRGQTGVNPTGTVYAAQQDIASFGGTSTSLGQKTAAASIPVTIASDQPGIVYNATQPTLMDQDASDLQITTRGALIVAPGTEGFTVAGTGSAGTAASGVLTVQGIASMTPVQVSQATAASLQATTTAVVNSAKYYISVGMTEDESQVKATAGTLVGISARNAHATTNAFIKCTNLTAANTTPGSSTIFYEMMVPAGGGFVDNEINVAFDTALTCYIVTGKAASDATEVAADDVSYFLRYR